MTVTQPQGVDRQRVLTATSPFIFASFDDLLVVKNGCDYNMKRNQGT